MECGHWTARDRRRAGSRFSGICILVAAWIALSVSGLVAASPPAEPAGPPFLSTFSDCSYFPDPDDLNVSYACWDFPPAFVNVTVRFRIGVSDPEGDPMNVTFFFDYIMLDEFGFPAVDPNSPNATVPVTPPGPDLLGFAETEFTYTTLNPDFSLSANESFYWVNIQAVDVNNESYAEFFQLNVFFNGLPFFQGISSPTTVSPSITPPDRVVPSYRPSVQTWDNDGDSLTVTWEWGDGSVSVNATGPASTPVNLSQVHDYPADQIPLNETPRVFAFPLVVWVDDGITGHNLSFGPYDIQFDLTIDRAPGTPVLVSPAIGPWKLGETVPMEGSSTDPEGDLITYYWDFDGAADSDGDGDPASDRDALGNRTSHAYLVAGDYNATLWATDLMPDGREKVLCADPYSCDPAFSHWRRQVVPVRVQPNQAPFVTVDQTYARIDEPVLLDAVILDPDGDTMNVTWIFGDGSANVTTTHNGTRWSPEAIQVLETHVYTALGSWNNSFNLTVRVEDGWGGETEQTVRLFVESLNEAPSLNLTFLRIVNATSGELAYTGNITYAYNETSVLQVNMTDPEGDDLELRVDWGDGNVTVLRLARTDSSLSVTNVSVANVVATCGISEFNETQCTFQHLYEVPAIYSVNATLTDHRLYLAVVNRTTDEILIIGHETTRFASITLQALPVITGQEPWDWWDYGTLALLLGVPAALLGRGAWRARRERREA